MTTKKEEDLRDDDKLRADLVDQAMTDAGLFPGGTLPENAAHLELHYLKLAQPPGWDPRPAYEGGRGAWHLTCEIAKGGCGYTSTAEQAFCVFCGDGQDEVTTTQVKPAEALVPADVEVEAEIVDEGDDLRQPDGELRGTAADLDRAVATVNERLRALEAGERSLTGNAWDLGVAIFDIFNKNLHVARRKDGGAPLYSSWAQFCKVELRMSSAKADRYMRIASNFTRELAQDLGPSKLVELLPIAQAQAADAAIAARLGRAPLVLLPPLLERARVLPVNELRAEVKAAMPARPPATGRAKGTEAAAAKRLAAKKPEAERVTVQRQEGRAEIRFYKTEADARAGNAKRAAREFRDGVVAVEPAVNGVEVVYTLRLDPERGALLHRRIVRVE